MARSDTLSFTPSHSLLNAKFESYKLSQPSPCLTGDQVVSTLSLPRPFTTPRLPEYARLSYHEVSDRARHNHLAAGQRGEALWVDAQGNVWAIVLNPTTAHPTIRHLATLPLPASSSSSTSSSPPAPASEYPSALCIAPHLWVVSSGQGTLHTLRVDTSTPSSWKGQLSPAYELRHEDEDHQLVPFRVHAAHSSSGQEAILLLSSVVKSASPSSASSANPPESSATPSTSAAKTRRKLPSTTAFEYLKARIPVAPSASTDVPKVLQPEWRLRGADLPAFVHFDAAQDRYCFASSAPLCLPSASTPATTQKTDTDMAGLGAQTSASLSAPSPSATNPADGRRPKPPPFSWLQDKDSLTVAFPIPSSTPTSSIRTTFSKNYLTLHIASPSSLLSPGFSAAGAATLPRLSHKKLWGEIDPHTSVWTFDREAEGRDGTFGVLTLHLEKLHAGTRWMDVFSSSSTSTSTIHSSSAVGGQGKIEELPEEAEYEGVPETVDPSELAAIAEKMDQWASSILPGSSSSGGAAEEGLGHGLPTSLMGDEMDVEVDGESGRNVVLTWVGPGGSEEEEEGVVMVETPHATIPTALISTSLPLSSPSLAADHTISIKHDVDALLFSPPSSSSSPASPSTTWTHLSTLPALSFVLATKRDTRFVYHCQPYPPSISAGAVLAFDAPAILPGSGSGAGGNRGGCNLFVYVAPPVGGKDKVGRSFVVKVGGPGCGALVGAVGVRMEGGELAVVALCEREVSAIRLFAE
ncbi:hypothetical protein JCM11641_000576 [Rhodosporidiobolus odoratus]